MVMHSENGMVQREREREIQLEREKGERTCFLLSDQKRQKEFFFFF